MNDSVSKKLFAHESFAYMILLAVAAIWGIHGVIGKSIGNHMEPFPLTLWRFTFLVIFYIPWLHRLPSILRLGWPVFIRIAVSGCCITFLFPFFFYESLQTLSPVASLMLINTSPFFAALLGRCFYKESLSWISCIGMLVSFTGTLVLIMDQWTVNTSMYGVLCGLISAVAFAVYTVSSRKLFQALPFSDVLMATSIIGAVCLWIITPFMGGFDKAVSSLAALPVLYWADLAYIVVFVSLLGYALNGFGLKRLPSGISSTLTLYPQPIFAAIVQWGWLDISPTLSTILSGILIFGGTAVMRFGHTKNKPIEKAFQSEM
jgi:drug/metabolite transporter (DMT)-like permease